MQNILKTAVCKSSSRIALIDYCLTTLKNFDNRALINHCSSVVCLFVILMCIDNHQGYTLLKIFKGTLRILPLITIQMNA